MNVKSSATFKTAKTAALRSLGFWRNLIANPASVGAVSPSGKALGREIASWVDFTDPGVVVELGPGTGAVTKVLVEAILEPARILAIEYEQSFCRELRKRFPDITVLQGDAYKFDACLDKLAGNNHEELRISAIVSCLPILNKPVNERVGLIVSALRRLSPGAPFIQFTYGPRPPVELEDLVLPDGKVTIDISKWVWRNLPPARVMVYRLIADN